MKKHLKRSLTFIMTLLMVLSTLTCLAMAEEEDSEEDASDKITVYITCDEKELRPGDTVDIDYTISPVENLAGFSFEVTEPDELDFNTIMRHGSNIAYLQDIMFKGDGMVVNSRTRLTGNGYGETFTSTENLYLFSARYAVPDDAVEGEVTFGLESVNINLRGTTADVVWEPLQMQIVVVDISALETEIRIANNSLSLEGYYSDHSMNNLKSALAVAQEIVENIRNYYQDNVDQALAALTAAVENLKTPKDELASAIETAEQLRESEYTKDTWGNLNDALEAAKEIQSKEDATSDDMNAAADALYDAIDALQPVDDPLSASREKLEADLEAVKALNESDYTADSWAVLQAAIEAAEEVLNNENATKEELDNADDVLAEAVEGLVAVAGSGNNNGSSGYNGSNSGSGYNGGTTGITSPQTGDSNILTGCMIVLAVAMGTCAVLFVSKARGTKE